jgi:hypothetical protein
VNIFETENYSACYNRMKNNFHNLNVGKVAAFSSDSIMYEGMELAFNQYHLSIRITSKANLIILPKCEKVVI